MTNDDESFQFHYDRDDVPNPDGHSVLGCLLTLLVMAISAVITVLLLIMVFRWLS
jgi:hypothetical protein